VLVPEINSGQLVRVLRAEYLVDAVGFNRVRGLPLATDEIYEASLQLLEGQAMNFLGLGSRSGSRGWGPAPRRRPLEQTAPAKARRSSNPATVARGG